MGRAVDLDNPLSDEDKQFLRDRGRGYQVEENERRFGPGGTAETDPDLEGAGAPAESASFDPDERDDVEYDVGGAPLPGRILDVDTGRVVPLSNRSNGSEGFDYIDPETGEKMQDPDDFDEDIIEEVEQIETVAKLKERLNDEKIDYTGKTKKEDLQDALIIGLQDKRNAEGGRAEDIATDAVDGQYIDPAKPETHPTQE